MQHFCVYGGDEMAEITRLDDGLMLYRDKRDELKHRFMDTYGAWVREMRHVEPRFYRIEEAFNIYAHARDAWVNFKDDRFFE